MHLQTLNETKYLYLYTDVGNRAAHIALPSPRSHLHITNHSAELSFGTDCCKALPWHSTTIEQRACCRYSIGSLQ